MENQKLLEYIQAKCPWKFIKVRDCTTFWWEKKQAFIIARDSQLINWVAWQYAEMISLWLDDNQRKYQIFWGNWWQYIRRNIDKTNENEKHYALGLEKMPSRLSKDYIKAIDKICNSYNEIVNDIASRWLTRWF